MKRTAQRLDRVVNALRRMKPQIGQRITGKDVERLANDDAARTWRRCRYNMIAAIIALDWRALNRLYAAKSAKVIIPPLALLAATMRCAAMPL